MKRTIATALTGFIAGAALTVPVAAEAGNAWRTWRGHQTGDIIMCARVKGEPAIEKDVTPNGRYVWAHCNTRNWGRP